MRRTVSAMDARRRLGELLESVYHRGDEVVIERAGRPMAVVIPAERYEAMQRSRERLFAFIDKVQAFNRDTPEDERIADVEAALREVRDRAPRDS